MKRKLFIFMFLGYFGWLFSQIQYDSLKIRNINQYVSKVENDKSKKAKKFSVVTKENKKINYEFVEKNGQIVKISRTWKTENNGWEEITREQYILKEEKMVFAFQGTESYLKTDRENQYGWSCNFWIEDNKVIYMNSLGHGKTEDENWDYEKEIRENFNFMMKTIRKHQNKK